MKLALCAVLSLLLIGTASAGQGNVSIGKLRLADAASDACIANCASQNDACKRVCPTTLGASKSDTSGPSRLGAGLRHPFCQGTVWTSRMRSRNGPYATPLATETLSPRQKETHDPAG